MATPRYFDDIAAMKAATPVADGEQVFVSGYYSPNDGGGGWYRWSAASALGPNDGSVIGVWQGSSYPELGRWLLVHDGVVTARQFGVRAPENPPSTIETLQGAITSGRFASAQHVYATYPGTAGQVFNSLKLSETVDWTSLQAATEWCAKNGVHLEIPTGVYMLSRPLWLADDRVDPIFGGFQVEAGTGLRVSGQIGLSRQQADLRSANLRIVSGASFANRFALVLHGVTTFSLTFRITGGLVSTSFFATSTSRADLATSLGSFLTANYGTGWNVINEDSDDTVTVNDRTSFFRILRPDSSPAFIGEITVDATGADGFLASMYSDCAIVSFRRGAAVFYQVENLTIRGNSAEPNGARNATFGICHVSSEFIGHRIDNIFLSHVDTCYAILKGTGNNGEMVRFSRLWGVEMRNGFYTNAPQAYLQEFDGWFLKLDNEGVYAEFAEAQAPGYGVNFTNCHATFGGGNNLDGRGTAIRVRRGNGIIQWTGGRLEHAATLLDFDGTSSQGANNDMDVLFRGVEFDGMTGQSDQPFVWGRETPGASQGTQYGLTAEDCRFRTQDGLTAAKVDLAVVAPPASNPRVAFERCRFQGVRALPVEGARVDFVACHRADFNAPGGTGLPLRRFDQVSGSPDQRTQSLRNAWQDTPWVQTGPRVNVLRNSTLNLQTTGTGQVWSAPSWTLERITGTGLPPTVTFGRWGTAGVSNVGDLNPGPESFGLVLPANRRLRNTVSYVDLAFDANAKVLTYQCLCKVTGSLAFRLVNSSDATVVYDEVVLDSGGSAPTDPTLVTLRMQVSGTGTGSPQLRVENTASEGGAVATWQVYWQQAWSGGGRTGSTVAQGLPNYGFTITPDEGETTENAYPWSVTAIGIKAFSRFQLPFKSEAFGWRANEVEGEDLNDGEVYYDDQQNALVARMEGEWVCVVQPERWFTESSQTTFTWNRGREKNIVMSADGTKTFTLNTGSNGAVAKGTVARVFNGSTSGEVRLNGSTINTIQPGNMGEFLFDGTLWRATQLDVKGRVV